MNLENPLENLVGLTLQDARAVLSAKETWRVLPVKLVETAPPVKPAPKNPRPQPPFGASRVLRAQCENDTLELTVARETLREAV